MTKYNGYTERSFQASEMHKHLHLPLTSTTATRSVAAKVLACAPKDHNGRGPLPLEVVETDFEIINMSLTEVPSQIAPYRAKRHSSISSDHESKRASVRSADLDIVHLANSPPSLVPNLSFIVSPPLPLIRKSRHSRSAKEASSLSDCSLEQRRILELVSRGKSVFFTGPAGVGKSFVLRKICQLFESQGKLKFRDFFVTASTGY
jgi:hypothetical protein